MDENVNFNWRLKQAVNSLEAPPFLEPRIRNRIRLEPRRPPRRSLSGVWIPALSLAAALCLGVGVAYELGHLRVTVDSQESYIASISSKVDELMRVGLGDHVHCAVFRKRAPAPPPVEKFVADLGPRYAGLLPAIRQHIPQSYGVELAHQCRYHQRKFVHLSLTGEGTLLSIVIANKREGESFEAGSFLPSLVRSGIPIYASGVQRFGIHAFEGRGHLVYLVSDLPKDENQRLMIALAPPLKEFLERL
ncbi:MAG: hypothetical protein K2X03_04170 [Bryobacteraceae bacterium]|nr:hypothetical protein [Bryobacteraceae bacterium]